MNKTLAANLTCTQTYNGRKFVHVRPGIVATYYLDGPVNKASAATADAVERYLDFVGPDAIQGYLANDGTYKSFNKARLDRDLKIMRSVPAKSVGPGLEYSSQVDGGMGEYGISLTGNYNDKKLFPDAVTLLQFEFPADALDIFPLDDLLAFAQAEAGKLEAQSGSIGFGLKRAFAFESQATISTNALLPRYLAMSPCFRGLAQEMRGKTPPAQWVTFVDEKLFSKLGGQKRLKQEAPAVKASTKGDLTFLRAAKLPPVGDSNRGAKDIGALPELARFLSPLRVEIAGFGDDKLDAMTWLARFDEMPAKDWDNE